MTISVTDRRRRRRSYEWHGTPWYGNGSATSRVKTVTDTFSRTFYLTRDFVLSNTPGTERNFLDVLVKKAGGNPFKPFGTWTRTF